MSKKNKEIENNLTNLYWQKPKQCNTRQDFVDQKNQKIADYVGDQTKHTNKKPRGNVFFCNITGRKCSLDDKTIKKLLLLHGSKEAIQKHFIGFKYRMLVERYGTAWLYLQITPKFIDLKRKLQMLMSYYNNETPKTDSDFKKIVVKMKKVTHANHIKILKPILHKKTDNHIDGVWLKGLPFMYDIFISAEIKQATAMEVTPEDFKIDEGDDNHESAEYVIEEPVE